MAGFSPITLGSAKSNDAKIASGFDHATRTGDNTFSIFFVDGSKVDLTIPLPKDGDKGDRGLSISNAYFDDDDKLVIELEDGSTLDPIELPTAKVDISKAEGNIASQKADGLYVPKAEEVDIVTSFGTTPSDDKVPSEKLVKDSLDRITGYTNLEINVDFNTLTTDGRYRTTTKRIDTFINIPIRIAGMLDVTSTGSIVYHTYKTVDDDVFIRSSEDGGTNWSEWKEIVTDTSMVEKAIADNWNGNGYNLIPFPYFDSNVANRNGIDWSVDDNGIVYATGTSTASRFNLHTRSKGELNDWTLENGDYYFYVESNCTDDRITVQFQITKNDTYYTLANVLHGGAKVEISGDDHYTDKASPQVQIYIPNGVIVDNVYFKIMLLKYNPNGTYPTEYQRFASGNVKLTDEISRKELELAELKMLGWTVPKDCAIQNTVSGNTFTQRVGRVELGALNYNKVKDGLFTTKIDGILGSASVGQPCNAYCKTYIVVAWENYEVMTDMTMQIRISTDVYIQNSAYTDANTFKTAMNGQYLYYELETSITKQIDGNEILEKDAVVARVENWVAPKSDEEILALPNGIYSINMGSASQTLFPANWGTLVVLKSKYLYSSMTFISSNAKYYYRNINNGAWRESAWKELATMDKVAKEDGTVPFNISLGVDRNELFKVGKVVTFNALFGSISGLSTKNTTFATIPEGYRPKLEKRFAGCIGETFHIFTIGTDGTIKCVTSSIPGGATICAFNGSWLTD